MAIKLPRISRVNPVAPESIGRTKVDLPDASKAMAANTRAVEGLGAQAIGYMNKVEQDAADTEATKRSMDYEFAFKRKLYGDGEKPGLKFQEGDPTPLYQTFDEEMDEEYKKLTDTSNMSPVTAKMVTRRVTDRANQLQNMRLTEYGYQQSKYEEGITRSAVDLEKQNLTDTTTLIQADAPDTLAHFDDTIGRIRDLHLKRGIKRGTVLPNENGSTFYMQDDVPVKVDMAPSAQMDLKKDLSEGVHTAVQNLIKAGQTDKADMIMKKYGDMIDPVRKASIADDFQKANIENKAYILAANPKEEGKLLGNLDQVTRDKVRDKASQIRNDRQARTEAAIERTSKQNYNLLAEHVMKRQRSGNPYVGSSELESDPVFKNAEGRIRDPKLREALYAMVETPKSSSPKAKAKIQGLFFGDEENADVTQMTPEEFATYKVGLSRTDQTYYDRKFESMKTETGSQEAARYKTASKELKDQLLAVNYLKEDQFNRVSGKEFDKFVAARAELDDFLDRRGNQPMTPKELNDFVRSYAVSKAKKQAFTPPETKKFQGTTTPKPALQDGAKVKGKTRAEWNRVYMQQNGKTASGEELNRFISEQE